MPTDLPEPEPQNSKVQQACANALIIAFTSVLVAVAIWVIVTVLRAASLTS